jgi:hypothetical protein
MDLLEEQRKAIYFNNLASKKNIEDLEEVFDLINKAAQSGEYEVILPKRIDLSEAQVKTLESRGFFVSSDYGDEENQWMIDWEDDNYDD